ncbi:agmatine deiminase [Acinetobacter colistiniresistens]|uniref:agmatine deiminase n=2 Tax=Acinetobacter colistiniresistens TaxID=280145 RepID=UPI00124FCE9C|nr:agmatine deiminase [Acinetobacter colistiniresistens]
MKYHLMNDHTYKMPAEWAPQDAVWMIWPYRTDNWRQGALPAQQAFAKVAEAISKTTPVFMAVPQAEMDKARQMMPTQVTLVEIESDDAWMRDTGPTIVKDQTGNNIAVDWVFNAWGGENGGLYANWDKDLKVARQVAQFHSIALQPSSMILEGGAIHVDGEGTLLTTSECLLHPNRNPEMTQTQIENELSTLLGIEKFIWLPLGVYNDETDGHIDNMCCFVRSGEVALHWTDDPNDPQYASSQQALSVLESVTDAKGRKLKVWKLPAPGPLYASENETVDVEKGNAIERFEGNRLAGSYVNYLISNQHIIFPLLDERTDEEAKALFQQMYPDYLITGVPAREILLGGGNIHCITQQIPK